MPRPEKHILICTNARPPGHPKGSCQERGASDLATVFANQLEARELKGRFRVARTSCLAPCEYGPTVLIYPEAVMYGGVTVDDIADIIDGHLLADRPVQRLLVPPEIW